MRLLHNLLINRDFGLLLMGRLVSKIGDGIHYFAVAWLVLDLTGSGAALGTLLMIGSLPGILLTPFSGVLADRWDRKHIIVSMDIMRGLLMLLLTGVYIAGRLTLPILYGATVLLSLCGVLFNPAIMATVPGLVKREELGKANARDAFCNSATGILGPIVGALLLSGLGYAGVFLVNGISFLLSALSETLIRFPKQTKSSTASAAQEGFVTSLKGGFRFLWENTGLRVLILSGLVLNFLFNPLFGVVLPFFGKEVLRMTPEYYGLSQSSFPVGMLGGLLIVSFLGSKFTKLRILSGAATLQGLLVITLGLLALPIVYTQLSPFGVLLGLAAPLLLMGVVSVQVNVQVNVMMQETVPDSFRGRVFSLFGSLMQAAAPLGMGLFGLLLDWIPVHLFFLLCGSVAASVALVLTTSTALRALCESNAAVAETIAEQNQADQCPRTGAEGSAV